jgi:hypothetical protein
MKNKDLAYDVEFGGYTTEQHKELEKALQRQRLKAYEREQALRHGAWRNEPQDIDVQDWDPETDPERIAFEAHRAKQEGTDRRRQEYLNAQSFMQSNPRYIPNPSNSNNLQAYLKKEGLTATPENLQKAFNEIAPILDLKPEVVQPPRIYSESEIRNMPLTPTNEWDDDGQISLLEVCHEQARQNMSLEIAQIEQDGKEQW